MLNSPQCAHCYSHTCWYLKKKGLAFALSSKSVNILSTTLTVFRGFPGGSNGKEFACNAGDLGLIPGLGRSPGEGKYSYPLEKGILIYPLQYSDLKNSMDCIIHGVAKSRTTLNVFQSINQSINRL